MKNRLQIIFNYGYVAILILALWVAVQPAPDIPVEGGDKWAHFLVYFGLMFLALQTQFTWGKPIFWLTIIASHGLLVEIMQHFVAYRSFDLKDWSADLTGSMLCFLIYFATKNKKRFLWLFRASR